MKKGWFILIAGAVYLLCSARSCNNGEDMDRRLELVQVDAARDSISAVCRMETPDGPALRAYELSAALKIRELWDYMRIAGDSSADAAFRNQALQMAGGLLAGGSSLPDGLYGLAPDSVWCPSPLLPDGSGGYQGEAAFILRNVETGAAVKSAVAGFQIRKELMIFGSDTVSAWKVYLRNFAFRTLRPAG